ncbi:hypothetical protein SAMN06265182_1527 [Persephonella hydrogeniphila]|uniref:2TM domain-containing protein n=1 Tax=Persephonella hydrogeniphila TaxID=198703 RepID=A0A285NIV3_9AQUI|nr:hypothetical protein [Persephonella hydrogeniphila]SNZ09442.1 hypothetical protein SAMN06265182_1527 [Persephonella hydrogeniphila]
MLNLEKVARQIKEEGLYTFIYNEMKEIAGKGELSEKEVLHLLKEEPKFLQDYKTLNTQSEISNIQIAQQEIFDTDSAECKELKETINRNRKELIKLEPYESKPDSMLYAVWIGSATIFLIFVIHNLIVLYTFWYENYPLLVYTSYMVVCVLGYVYYRKRIKDHIRKYLLFKQIEKETKELIKKGIEEGYLSRSKIYE